MEMTDQRKGEIAYAIVKVKAKADGIRYDVLRREIGNISKKTGILVEDLEEFATLLNLEIIEETFCASKKGKPGIPHPDGPFSPKK